MPKYAPRASRDDLDRMFKEADRQWEAGDLKRAFRLFLACAKGGDSGCQINLGTFYCHGIGVKADRDQALYWYRRAYRRGLGPAASNIGMLLRDEKKLTQALAWFERAVKLKDKGANLDIAKIYLERDDRPMAIRRLKETCKAKPTEVPQADREEAERLLKSLLSPSPPRQRTERLG